MAKYSYKTLGGKLTVEFEAANTKELVEELSAVQDVCEQEKCSNCGKSNFRFITRAVGDDKYYELMCNGCWFKLGFGQPKKGKGNLYPRRRNNKTKEPIGPKKDGWHKFEGDNHNDDEKEGDE